MAAFSDSTPVVGMRRSTAPARSFSRTPRPSLPMMRAHLRVRSTSPRFRSPAGTAA